MKFHATAVVVLILAGARGVFGQDTASAPIDDPEPSTYERVMTIGEAIVLVPMTLGTTLIGIAPPSGGLLIRDGRAHWVLSFESGVGFGQRANLKRFSDARFTVGFTHLFGNAQKDFLRLEAKRDLHIAFIDRREILLFGISPLGGMFTEFPSTGYSVGLSAWLMTPWISYFGFIPQHTFGLTYRYNRYLSGNGSHEITAGISAAFTWGW